MWAVLLWLKLIGFPWCPLLATCRASDIKCPYPWQKNKTEYRESTRLKKPYWWSPVISCALSQFQLNWGGAGLQGRADWIYVIKRGCRKYKGTWITLKKIWILFKNNIIFVCKQVMLAELLFWTTFSVFSQKMWGQWDWVFKTLYLLKNSVTIYQGFHKTYSCLQHLILIIKVSWSSNQHFRMIS